MQIARVLTTASRSSGHLHLTRIPQTQAIAQQTSRALHLQNERKANEDEYNNAHTVCKNLVEAV